MESSLDRRSQAFVALWLAAVVAGLGGLGAYMGRAGRPAHVSSMLPAEFPVELGPRGALVMFVHPHCPCSSASLEELAEVLRLAPDAPRAELLVFADPDAGEDWVDGRIWRRAAALPGLRRRLDPGGALARGLGVTTSGHVLAYDSSGHLLFDGGLTPGRGHPGPSGRRAALLAALGGGLEVAESHLVYGCGLGPAEEPEASPTPPAAR